MTKEEAILYMSLYKKKLEVSVSVGLEEDIEAFNMAIKALEQEPCEDCISRDMALERMSDYVSSGYADSVEDFEAYSKIICELPTVTPQEPKIEWIPVSERLPELHQKVIVTYVTEDGANIAITHYDKYGFLIGEGIAWQPLPKPYKESED